MRVRLVDERDSQWEQHRPTFRVYFFKGHQPYAVAAYDAEDVEIDELMEWAREQAGGEHLYAIALVSANAAAEPGLVWLLGMDANDAAQEDQGVAGTHFPERQRTFDRMLRRRLDGGNTDK